MPFIVIVAIALGSRWWPYHPPTVLFGAVRGLWVVGYAAAYRKAKGKPVSVIATSTDELEWRKACTAEKRVLDCAPMTFPTAITLALLPEFRAG